MVRVKAEPYQYLITKILEPNDDAEDDKQEEASDSKTEEEITNPCVLCKCLDTGDTECPYTCRFCTQGYHDIDSVSEILLQKEWHPILCGICKKCRIWYDERRHQCLLYYADGFVYHLYTEIMFRFGTNGESDIQMCQRCRVNSKKSMILVFSCPKCKVKTSKTGDTHNLQCAKCRIWLAGVCATFLPEEKRLKKASAETYCVFCRSLNEPRPPHPLTPPRPPTPPVPPAPPPSPSPPPEEKAKY